MAEYDSRGPQNPGGGRVALSRQAVLPGDEVLRLPEAGVVRVGAGLQQRSDALVTDRAGVLRRTKGGKLWVEGSQKRRARSQTQAHIQNMLVYLRHIVVKGSFVVVNAFSTAAMPSLEVYAATFVRHV